MGMAVGYLLTACAGVLLVRYCERIVLAIRWSNNWVWYKLPARFGKPMLKASDSLGGVTHVCLSLAGFMFIAIGVIGFLFSL